MLFSNDLKAPPTPKAHSASGRGFHSEGRIPIFQRADGESERTASLSFPATTACLCIGFTESLLRGKGWILALSLLASAGWGFAPTEDQCAVTVRWPDASREVLEVEGQTYTLLIHRLQPKVELLSSEGKRLAWTDKPGCTLGGDAVIGPGRINIYNFGTQMYEIHLRDLRCKGFKDGEIEMAFFCYGERIFVQLNATSHPEKTPPAPQLSFETIAKAVLAGLHPGSKVKARYCMFAPDIAGREIRSTSAQRSCVAFLTAETSEKLGFLMRQEAHPESVEIKVEGGRLQGYQSTKGFYQIQTEFAGPRGFEEAWINPNQRIEVDLQVKSPFPAEILCNVWNSYGVLEGAVLADTDGFPLPVQVQVCKNFAGEFEEGKKEGDTPYGMAFFPVKVEPEKPFQGKLFHLFGHWGTHPLKQISSIRFFHHYFHASLGPTETFCYVPFEFPRDDDRDYVLADVRGLSNFGWPGQPQHDHVSVVGALRYKTKQGWINNLLKDTRIYLTSPNLASFALDYLSEDGKVATTLEVFEVPEEDEARSFIRMKLKVLGDVKLEGPSSHHLRFLNAGSYIVRTKWPKIAYTASSEKTERRDVSANDEWVLEAEPLGASFPFAAAFPHKNGNMCFFIHKFGGVLGGKETDHLGLSCFGGKDFTEMFLTAPGEIEALKKGDHFDAHLFVMPYGHANVNEAPAERQRSLFGEGIATVEVTHGEAFPGYPRRMRIDERGFCRFTLTGGSEWTPFLVEGFSSHKAPMLWEKRGSWLFHDQQVNGNDWFQSYRASDGSAGFVFVVEVRPGQTHDYLVALAPNARAIRQKNGFVTVEGGPMSFWSPVPFEGLECRYHEKEGLFHCEGERDLATSCKP